MLTLRTLIRQAAPMLWGAPLSKHGVMSCVKIEWIIEHIGGNEDIELIDMRFVDRIVTELQGIDKSPATINRYLSALRVVLEWAAKRGLIKRLPAFTWQHEPQGRLRYLTEQEEHQMVSALLQSGNEIAAAFVIVAIETGCRRSELLHATRDQLDGPWLRLWKTKNGVTRSVPLSRKAQLLLEVNLPWKLTEPQLRYAWEHAKAKIGLSDDHEFVVHALRHTRATRLVKQGVNLAVIQKLMGHRDIKTTLRYAHVADDTLLKAVSQE